MHPLTVKKLGTLPIILFCTAQNYKEFTMDMEEDKSLEERQFLLCAMGLGIMDEETALENFRICKDETRADTINEMESLIACINRNISDFDQKIEKYRYELNDVFYYIFINTSESLLNKFQSHFTQPDLHYFRLLVKAIALSETGMAISDFQALEICSHVPIKPITKIHGEKLLEEWYRKGYFYQNEEQIIFGPRMVVEFSNYLRLNYPNTIHTCKLCRQITLSASKCFECEADFHRDCIRKYLIRVSNCPECKKPWKSSLDDLNGQEDL